MSSAPSTGSRGSVQTLSFSADQELTIAPDARLTRRERTGLSALPAPTASSGGSGAKGGARLSTEEEAALHSSARREVTSAAQKKEVAASKFYRGPGTKASAIDRVRNPQLRGKLRETERVAHESALRTKHAQEVLLPSSAGALETEGMDKTWQLRQEHIVAGVQEGARDKAFALSLPDFGPYAASYTRNGRHLLLGGRRGHIAVFDWQKFALKCEVHVKETIRDVQMLHNETMFAVAQKKYVHIYDGTGMELHVLRNQLEVNRLDFLPYHYLMVSVSKSGILRYQDTSTGQAVAELKTRLGDCGVLRQNPTNAIVHLGHTNGTATLWSPNVDEALVKVQCHNAPISALCVAPDGRHMVTAGLDGTAKVWDLRNSYKELHSYTTPRPATSIDISQSGLLALGSGPHVHVWRGALASKQQSPYLYEQLSGCVVREVRFCPYEDVLGVGHDKGFNSFLVPGAGEANFDTLEANPFETQRQQAEKTVKSLLEKLQPSMITLDPRAFGLMSKDAAAAADEAEAARRKEASKVSVDTDRKRRRDTSSKRALRRQLEDATEAAELRRERKQALAEENKARREQEAKEAAAALAEGAAPKSALDRFKARG